MPKVKYEHAEAFNLMWYCCFNSMCQHTEQIWNSRDGVAPFTLRCPSCGKLDLTHVNWSMDVHAPEHKLHKGQRYFRDGTAKEAIQIIHDRVLKAHESGDPIPHSVVSDLLRDAKEQTGEWLKGWPMLAVHGYTCM